MSSSIINQVLANSQSIVDAGEKLGLMTDPLEIPRVNEDIGDEAGTKITIPSVDDDTEYPDLSSTVEGAWNVLDLGQAEIHEDDGARTANELDFVVVSCLHCIIVDPDMILTSCGRVNFGIQFFSVTFAEHLNTRELK